MKHPEYKNLEEFIRHLEEPNSNYPWISKDLPKNPTLEQKIKFEICQLIIGYKYKHNLTAEQLAEIILKDYRGHPNTENKLEGIKKILFCWIEEFDLKELINCANHCNIDISLKFKEIKNEPPTNQPTEWDSSLNNQKILEIAQAKLNNKVFEPLPEPILLWKREIYFLENTYRGIKYKMIFELESEKINLKNIWVVSSF